MTLKAVAAVAAPAIVPVVATVPDLTALPWGSIGFAMVLAFFGGLVGTIKRFKAGNLKFPVPVEIGIDGVFSAFAGYAGFVVAGMYALDIWTTALLIPFFGFGGQLILDAMLNGVVNTIKGAGGSSNDK